MCVNVLHCYVGKQHKVQCRLFDTQSKMQIETVLLAALVLAELVSSTNVIIDYNSKDLPVIPVPNITSDATHIRRKTILLAPSRTERLPDSD